MTIAPCTDVVSHCRGRALISMVLHPGTVTKIWRRKPMAQREQSFRYNSYKRLTAGAVRAIRLLHP